MNDPRDPDAREQPLEAAQDNRKPYAPPALRFYGAVRDLTLGGGSENGEAGAWKIKNPPSDPVLKHDVVRVGTHPLGIGLYVYEYKPQYRDFCPPGRFLGVMADEVEVVRPEAVSVGSHGFRQVDYTRLL